MYVDSTIEATADKKKTANIFIQKKNAYTHHVKIKGAEVDTEENVGMENSAGGVKHVNSGMMILFFKLRSLLMINSEKKLQNLN